MASSLANSFWFRQSKKWLMSVGVTNSGLRGTAVGGRHWREGEPGLCQHRVDGDIAPGSRKLEMFSKSSETFINQELVQKVNEDHWERNKARWVGAEGNNHRLKSDSGTKSLVVVIQPFMHIVTCVMKTQLNTNRTRVFVFISPHTETVHFP